MGTSLRLDPLGGTFGAIVRDVDLNSLDDATWNQIHEAWIEYALLIFVGQFLSKSQQNSFAERFGQLEFGAAPIANVDRDGNVITDPNHDVAKSLRGNQGWHHDSTYMPVQAKGAVFTAEIVPDSGGETGFADMRAAYEALDDETRGLIKNMSAHHSLSYSQGRTGNLPTRNEHGGYDMYGYHDAEVPIRPLVKVHPDTGAPNLLIGRHAHDIVGMDGQESVRLLDRLNEEACLAPRVHHHHWTVGDAIVWDNRRLQHQATPYDLNQPRRMWHTRIAGERATELAINHA